MNILNSDSNAIAQYGADAIIGRTAVGQSNVLIDSDGNVDVRKGTTVSASFGTTTTIGPVSSEHVKISSTGVELKDASNVYGKFAATTTIGKVSNNEYVNIDGNGVKVYGGSATDYTFMDANSFDVITSGAVSASFGTTTTIGPTSGKHVSITSSGIALKVASTTYGTFAETVTIGNTSDAYLKLDSGSFEMYDGAGTQLTELNAGTLTLGGAHGSTSKTVKIASDGVTSYYSSTYFSRVGNTGLKVYSGHATNPAAHFGTDVSLYGNTGGTRTLHITAHGINIGKGAVGPSVDATPSAVIGNISLHSGGARIYGAATNDYVDVKSDGVDVIAAGATVAAFGATTTVGKAGFPRTVFTSSELGMYSWDENEGTTYKRLIMGVDQGDNLAIAIGGALDEDVTLTTTDKVVRIDGNNGVYIYDN
jgi:hypothetical protein